MRSFWVIIFVSLLAPCVVPYAATGADTVPLTVNYIEYPPYYYTNTDGKPAGFLFEKAERILLGAGIRTRFESLPAKRVLQNIEGYAPLCSIGWFKTPEREEVARFSDPIYQNRPLSVLYLKKNEQQMKGKETLAQFLADRTLVLGQLDGYSLGSDVDATIRKLKPRHQMVVGDYLQLVRMLASERFSYLLVAPEDIDVLLEKNGLPSALFGVGDLNDVPAGNLRYLMFSRGVSDEIIFRVNQAIRSLR